MKSICTGRSVAQRQIREEHVGTAQHAHEQRSLTRVVLAQLTSQLRDAFGQLIGAQKDRTDVRIVFEGGYRLSVGGHGARRYPPAGGESEAGSG